MKEPHRIHLTPAFPHFEVQVIPGGVPSAAHQGDDIPLLHFLPSFYQHLRTVSVQGFVGFIMPDFHIVAVAPAPGIGAVGGNHNPVRRGQDGCALRSRDIHPIMKGNLTGDGIGPVPKGRGDGKIPR